MATAAYFPALPAGAGNRSSEMQTRDAHQSHHQQHSSRPLQPPHPEIPRWELPDISHSFSRDRDRSMPLDYGHSTSHRENGLYGQAGMDSSFGVHEPTSAHSTHGNAFDRESMEGQGHRTYDAFAGSGTNGRYRANSSSSMGFGMNSDPVYSSNHYADPPASYAATSSSPFDLLDTSYANGKVSPLTPNELAGGLHHPSLYSGQRKEYPSSNGYPELERRPASGYSSEFPDDYAIGNPLPSTHSQTIGRYSDSRYSHPVTHNLHGHSDPEVGIRSVAPQATHAFRSDITGFDSYMQSNPQTDMPLRMPTLDETLVGLKLHGNPMGSSDDLETFIRPYLAEYVDTPNRLAFGERTVLVLSSRVAQKSYGTEKRFLCPPPTAILIGNSWWNNVPRRGDEQRLSPPKVQISISGEPQAPDGSIEWSSSSGKAFDSNDPPNGTTFIGRCVGKQLFISDVDEKKKKVLAIVKITAPTIDDGPERVIGTFESRPIKVISKPSKKRQSAKNLELCINHGSTISLFHRLRSQTVSTKYLCVSGSGSSFKGSDGAPLMGLDHRSRSSTPSFIARTASWDPFVVYIVDVNKPAGGIDSPPPPPPQPDYPSPPPNSIPFTNNGSQIPIYYNQTIVLQCLTSGVVSPVLIIRKVDHQTCVVGGGLQEGAKNIADQYCPPGEVCGDPVSQLHKVAFEVHDQNSRIMPDPGTPGLSGAFLSCLGEKVNTYRPVDPRQWNQAQEAHSPGMSASPINSSGNEYFGHDSVPASPTTSDFLSLTNDGGRVRNAKKRSDSTASSMMAKSTVKGRRRAGSAASAGSAGRRGSASDTSSSSGSLWQIDIGESSVWTLVGTDQVRYNFYVPPVLFDNQHAIPSGSFPIPSKPITPFPAVVKYLPPDRSAETPKTNGLSTRSVLGKPNPHASKLLTVYGENFSKADPVSVFFGPDPSPFVEVRCTEVLGCLPPSNDSLKRRPVILVRSDGVVFPSSTMYP